MGDKIQCIIALAISISLLIWMFYMIIKQNKYNKKMKIEALKIENELDNHVKNIILIIDNITREMYILKEYTKQWKCDIPEHFKKYNNSNLNSNFRKLQEEILSFSDINVDKIEEYK